MRTSTTTLSAVLLRRRQGLDLKRVRTPGLRAPMIRQFWNGRQRKNRVLLTHDVRTMTEHAWQRVAHRQVHAGVFEISRHNSCRAPIEDILLLVDLQP